jgi:predicted RNA-binding Zn-ribbon protein involved in translation (DUF1610 family)
LKITFPCSRCGKRLKARESAAGQTRKCPVCATRVTCPGPADDADVVDAEVVETEIVEAELVVTAQPVAIGGGVNPYADLDDGGAYAVVDPGPAANAASETEARRPCPMCGETILASAAKCRFCGEVFDAVLKKGKGRKSGKRSSRRGGGSNPTAVRDLGIGVVMTVAGVVLTLISFAHPVQDSQGQGKSVFFYGLILGGIGGIFRGIRGFASSD